MAHRFLAAAIDTPVLIGDGAVEGGAWGIAILAVFGVDRAQQSLVDFLTTQVFADSKLDTAEPDPRDVPASTPMERYITAHPVERAAVEHS